MTTWPPKDPDETVKKVVDWSDEIGTDTIASYTMVPTGTASVLKSEQSGRAIAFWITGGTDGTTTTFLHTLTTSTGQVLERSFSLYVESGADSFRQTSTTKRQLVEQMFTECALNGWEYDLDPSEKDTALTRLDMLMWELRGQGCELGYNFPTAIGGGDLDDPLGCPDQAFSGLALLGAERLCPTMGKRMSPESRIALRAAMRAVMASVEVLVPTMRLSQGTPLGSGNKPWSTHWPFSMTSS